MMSRGDIGQHIQSIFITACADLIIRKINICACQCLTGFTIGNLPG